MENLEFITMDAVDVVGMELQSGATATTRTVSVSTPGIAMEGGDCLPTIRAGGSAEEDGGALASPGATVNESVEAFQGAE